MELLREEPRPIARHFSPSGAKSPGPISWHSAFAAGAIHGCALFMNICATGVSQVVSSSVPARMLTICSRPARSPEMRPPHQLDARIKATPRNRTGIQARLR
jgi:hypothetical protein